MQAMHSIIEIRPKPASEAGALDGFEAVCSCGYRVGSSLRGLATQWGREHAEFMNLREARASSR